MDSQATVGGLILVAWDDDALCLALLKYTSICTAWPYGVKPVGNA
jgi:hypothetical protein